MGPFGEIYCLVKKSELDHHRATPERADRLLKLSRAKQAAIADSAQNQADFMRSLAGLDQKLGLKIRYIKEEQINQFTPQANDLVLSAGGDGTFLSCAQHFGHATLLGLNSDYKPRAGLGSYGALTMVNRTNLEERLTQLVEGHWQEDRWNRLQASVNGIPIPRFAVNDIYYGMQIAYRTCDIIVTQGGQSQDFNCSGLLCCTGMGSHAWYSNAGGSPFSNELDAFGFRVLFPNLKRPLKFMGGVISKRHELLITPEREGYVLSFDSGTDVIYTEMGDQISIFIDETKALRLISFD